ncbi:hypothetical protein G7046_g1904 [Stylonectria norvegica]|nr:hypothetical protein G7046_g1904 [Stylonectria norvegica]
MQFPHHALIDKAAKIPTPSPTPVLSFSPVVLPSPNRQVDLQLKVSAPSTGDALPIILLSHGHGQSNYLSSMEGYAPLADFWAGHGFAVIQPTHLSSKSLGIVPDATNIRDLFLDSRARDMSQILGQLDLVEATVPGLKGRLDRTRIAVAGHSLGGLTASVLLGAVNTDPRDGTKTQLLEKRIKAGVLIGTPGHGGADMTETGGKILSFHGIDFSEMRTPTLVVWGEEDASTFLTTSGPAWHVQPYKFSPSPKASFSVKGGQHGFGGISGWDAGETLDESPERLATVQRVTLAYLKSQLYEGDDAWQVAKKALGELSELGAIEEK